MPDDDLESGQLELPSVGGFLVVELLSTSGDVRLYGARDEQVDRRVLLRVAGEAGAGALLEDARRIAAVSHPGLVSVLGAGRSEVGAYAAVPDADVRSLAEVQSLSSEQAARVAIDVAGAIGALSQAGLRARVDGTTVLVAQAREGVHGLLDPLRSLSSGQSCLDDADPAASTRQLAALLAHVVPRPSDALRRAIEGVRSGVCDGPEDFIGALAPLAAKRAARPRRPLAFLAVACLALAAAVGAAIVVHGRSDHASRPTTSASPVAPAARVVTRIPLGLNGQQEVSWDWAVLGRFLWISTSAGRVLRVDANTDGVVGSPVALAFGGQGSPLLLESSGGSLFAVSSAGWLVRIDPRTGAIAARRRLGGVLAGIQAQRGVLWITRDDGPKGSIIRVDARTLRPIGKPIDAGTNAGKIVVEGSRAWVLGGDPLPKVTRVDLASGTRRSAYVGVQVIDMVRAGGTLWFTDRINGTVSAMNAQTLEFDRPALLTPRSAFFVLPMGNELWVSTSDTLASQVGSVQRFDARSGRRAGRAVPVPGAGQAGAGLKLARGSLWALGDTILVRLAPTVPQPSLQPAVRVGASPHALVPGPLAAGSWRATSFATPFSITTPAFAWLAVFPQADGVQLLATAARLRGAGIEILAPRDVFATDGAEPRVVGDPASLLRVLEENPRLSVSGVRHTTIGGRPALQFEVRAHNPKPHPEICASRCVLLYPLKDRTFVVGENEGHRVSLISSHGRTIVISQTWFGASRTALATSAALVRTITFAR